jgi:hypothetical protein
MYADSSPGGTDAIICETGIQVSSDLGQEIVHLVAFAPFEPLTVGMVVDQLGYPDAVRVNATMPGEGQRSMMDLYYPTTLTRLMLPDQEGGAYRLQQDTPVERVVYHEEGLFEELRASASPWAGFGEYTPR